MTDSERDRLLKVKAILSEADNALCSRGFEYEYGKLHEHIWNAIDVIDDKLKNDGQASQD